MNPQLESNILCLLLDQEVVGDEGGQRDDVLKFLEELLITVEVIGIIVLKIHSNFQRSLEIVDVVIG